MPLSRQHALVLGEFFDWCVDTHHIMDYAPSPVTKRRLEKLKELRTNAISEGIPADRLDTLLAFFDLHPPK